MLILFVGLSTLYSKHMYKELYKRGVPPIQHKLKTVEKGKKRKHRETLGFTVFFGGDKRDRTANLLNAIAPEVLDSVEVA